MAHFAASKTAKKRVFDRVACVQTKRTIGIIVLLPNEGVSVLVGIEMIELPKNTRVFSPSDEEIVIDYDSGERFYVSADTVDPYHWLAQINAG